MTFREPGDRRECRGWQAGWGCVEGRAARQGERGERGRAAGQGSEALGDIWIFFPVKRRT